MRILRTKKLKSEHIQALAQDDLLAVRVEGYYPEEASDQLSQKILESRQVSRYTHEIVEGGELKKLYFGVDRLGFAYNLTYGAGEEVKQKYYEKAERAIHLLRRYSSPFATPVDKLRLELDERFPYGANVAAFEGRKMLAGIGRITLSKYSHLSAEQPHFDALPEAVAKLDAQLAANIYLKVPSRGGELELWDVPPTEPLMSVPKDWRAILPPSQLIAPKKGEMIIFNCRRPHAIREFSGVNRVTMQVFLGYQEARPLQLWN